MRGKNCCNFTRKTVGYLNQLWNAAPKPRQIRETLDLPTVGNCKSYTWSSLSARLIKKLKNQYRIIDLHNFILRSWEMCYFSVILSRRFHFLKIRIKSLSLSLEAMFILHRFSQLYMYAITRLLSNTSILYWRIFPSMGKK